MSLIRLAAVMATAAFLIGVAAPVQAQQPINVEKWPDEVPCDVLKKYPDGTYEITVPWTRFFGALIHADGGTNGRLLQSKPGDAVGRVRFPSPTLLSLHDTRQLTPMRLPVDLQLSEIPALLSRAIAITGAAAWTQRENDFSRQIAQNPIIERYLDIQFALEPTRAHSAVRLTSHQDSDVCAYIHANLQPFERGF